jgi:C1A family cysteine protease
MPELHLKGWKRDKPDTRDFKYRTLYTVPRSELARKSDMRPDMSQVENQGHTGSCTANSAVGTMEYLKRDRLNRRVLCMKVRRDLSRLFLYYNTRAIEGTVDVDSGASIRNTVKALAKQGVCYARSWPYVESRFDEKPDEDCYKEAERYKIVSYYRVESVDEALNALAQKLPVCFGALLYESFNDVARTGKVKLPEPGERTIGAHAMLLVGYKMDEDGNGDFIVRNSWGEGWGLGGYCYLPFGYCTFGGRVDDFWVIKG